ncbi:hypothetical protein [Motiliproteus sp. MSK22-1]|uniref:hypothetical protein n=1 Tax=Motiliproteus sp. MSK22-1 TaxID=1897630 RepID=UPI000976437F|nr:hypothetical protein [Motiliproteus sp. MSK22-1]OMH39688.1 hypothetical protein BGP75_02305 [Motiliproteus sp. MSK22-1]
MKKIVLVALLGVTAAVGSVANSAMSLLDELTRYRNLGSLKAISALKTDNARLIKQNKMLSGQISAAKKKVAARKNRVVKKSLIRANRKIATAGATLLPVSGTLVVGSVMALEIHELCQDAKDMTAFEKDLFGQESASDPDQERLCGMDIEAQIAAAQNAVSASYQSLKKTTVSTFQESAEYLREWQAPLLNDAGNAVSVAWEDLLKTLSIKYQQGADSFIEPKTTPYAGFSQQGTIIRLNND